MADGKTEGLIPAERFGMTRSFRDMNISYENIKEAEYEKSMEEHDMKGALTLTTDCHTCAYCGRKIPIKTWFGEHFICVFCGGGE